MAGGRFFRRNMGAVEPAAEPTVWTPTEKQGIFLSRQEDEVLFGGSKYGAKTDGLLIYAIARRQIYPNSRGLFIRRELTEITKQGAAWDRIKQILGNSVRYNESDHLVIFPNGSVQEFAGCKEEGDKLKYQGSQYDDICFDQLEQFTESMFLFISTACRRSTSTAPKNAEGEPIQPRIRASCNPGDIGHAWVKRRYVDAAPPFTTIELRTVVDDPVTGGAREQVRRLCFVPATVFDNPHADPAQLAVLDALPEPMRSMYLYGKWDVFVGQAFPDFHPINPKTYEPYHVIPVQEIPSWWERFEMHDWGYDHPMYTGWIAIDPEGGGIVYKELTARGWRSPEIARRILQTRGADEVNVTWCGRDIWQEHRARMGDPTAQTERFEGQAQSSSSIIRMYEESGLLTCQPLISDDRLSGKQMIHEWLRERKDGTPFLRIMENCQVLIKTLQMIPLNPNRSEDVLKQIPADAEVTDDPYDGLRAGLISIGHVTEGNEYSRVPASAPMKGVATSVR